MSGSNQPKKTVVGLAEILTLDDALFVSAVRRILTPLPEPAWMLCSVAYQNLELFMLSVSGLAREYQDPDAPSDLDGVIRFLAKHMLKPIGEIEGRRLAWFFHAAIIRRATEIASHNPSLYEEVAAIWIMLARGSAFLSELLPPNTLWSNEEKACFNAIKNEQDGIRYCLQTLAPAYLRKGSDLLAFAEAHDIPPLPE